MPRSDFRLTEKSLKALTTDKRREDFVDCDLTGFGVRVTAAGKKTFFVRVGSRRERERITLGEWGEVTLAKAREKAEKIVSKYRLGEMPVQRSKLRTFDAWAGSWLAGVEKRKKWPQADRRYIADARRRWGPRPLAEVTYTDVVDAMAEVAETTKARHEAKLEGLRTRAAAYRESNDVASAVELERQAGTLARKKNVGHTQANRWLASVRACFADAVKAKERLDNPAHGVKPFRENPPRARVLTDKEMGRLRKALAAVKDPHVRAAFWLLIYTGARRSEVLRARWDDLDLAAGEWRIPSPKAGHPQLVPLPSQAVTVLRNTPRLGEWLVPGRDPAFHRHDLVKPWRELVEAAELEGVTVHDIRRTFGLKVARAAGLHVASKLLRHADVRITERVYAPLDFEEQRAASEKVQPKAEVVNIEEARK